MSTAGTGPREPNPVAFPSPLLREHRRPRWRFHLPVDDAVADLEGDGHDRVVRARHVSCDRGSISQIRGRVSTAARNGRWRRPGGRHVGLAQRMECQPSPAARGAASESSDVRIVHDLDGPTWAERGQANRVPRLVRRVRILRVGRRSPARNGGVGLRGERGRRGAELRVGQHVDSRRAARDCNVGYPDVGAFPANQGK